MPKPPPRQLTADETYALRARDLAERRPAEASAWALLAVVELLSQMNVCDHGTRGWCPWCARAINEGTLS